MLKLHQPSSDFNLKSIYKKIVFSDFAAKMSGGSSGGGVPNVATDAVLVQSQEMPEGSEIVKVGYIVKL